MLSPVILVLNPDEVPSECDFFSRAFFEALVLSWLRSMWWKQNAIPNEPELEDAIDVNRVYNDRIC